MLVHDPEVERLARVLLQRGQTHQDPHGPEVRIEWSSPALRVVRLLVDGTWPGVLLVWVRSDGHWQNVYLSGDLYNQKLIPGRWVEQLKWAAAT